VTRTVRRSIAASAAALSLLAFAGCGGDDDSTASDQTSDSSSASTPSADAMSTETTDTESDTEGDAGAAEGEEVSAEEFTGILEKALDEATTANVELTSSMGLNATGQIDYTSDQPSAQMKTEMAQTGSLETILVGKEIYLKGAMFGGGDKWIKVSLDDPNNPMSALGDQLDPAASLEKLKDGIKSAVYVGEEDGLDHYTATVDTKSLLAGTGAEGGQAQAGLPDTVDYDLWFDGDGRFSKFSFDLGGAGTTEATFSDWGTDVDITAPPAAETTTMPGM
jgi:hypothetical protein